jgi:ABC-type microcin C transport system permease subunit YejB
MTAYIIRRLLYAVPITLGVVLATKNSTNVINTTPSVIGTA